MKNPKFNYICPDLFLYRNQERRLLYHLVNLASIYNRKGTIQQLEPAEIVLDIIRPGNLHNTYYSQLSANYPLNTNRVIMKLILTDELLLSGRLERNTSKATTE